MDRDKFWDLLSSAYLFGDRIQDTIFKDRVIDSITLITHAWNYQALTIERSNKVFFNTLRSSPFRRLVIDIFTYEDISSILQEYSPEGVNHEFLFELSLFCVQDLKVDSIKKQPKSCTCQRLDVHITAMGKMMLAIRP
ncbi:hypothetical protein M501DRAFT_1013613 [Patellaria atrata CBS 101060]|uniref:Uncharacterized protein n=1 Tax=Patellaria atrata CBS 101060 TaxID=1346257 RepID=A0A9P4SGU7_9PEZI|nr:hypothetical protein M501DRAFT_1013613 [Patellaria atrata CBS 101060]